MYTLVPYFSPGGTRGNQPWLAAQVQWSSLTVLSAQHVSGVPDILVPALPSFSSPTCSELNMIWGP